MAQSGQREANGQLKLYLTTADILPIARLGMIWIIIVLVACVATANLQQAMVIRYAERFAAWQYQDFVCPTSALLVSLIRERRMEVLNSETDWEAGMCTLSEDRRQGTGNRGQLADG